MICSEWLHLSHNTIKSQESDPIAVGLDPQAENSISSRVVALFRAVHLVSCFSLPIAIIFSLISPVSHPFPHS